MRKCDVPDTAIVKMPQILQVPLDRRGVFHAEGERNQAGIGIPAYLIWRVSHCKLVRGLRCQLLDHVDQLISECFRAALLFIARRDIDRHECRVEPARASARIIEITRLGAA
ncbi:hypothetical protein BH24PSE2_BH24PSE2_04430 [soil metagenome]